MATLETNTELGRQVVADAKQYVLHSWSVQNAVDPIPVAGGEGRYFWDYDGKRYLDFASQLVNGSITLTGDPRRWPAEPGIPGVVRMLDPYTYRCPAGHPDPCPVCTGAPHLEEILQYEG